MDATTSTGEQANDTMQKTATNVSALANKIDETIKRSQERINELQTALVDKTKYAAQSTDQYVHEKPWTAVACAAGFGLIVGLLMGRR